MVTLKDDAIQRQVEQAIAFDPRVTGFDVRVRVLKGTVRLEGIVKNLEAKRAAEEAAAAVPGIRRVDNTLTVDDPRGLSNLDIGKAVNEALAGNPAVDPYDVGASLLDGTAHLVGHVDNVADEQAAIHAASRAEGVKDIVSELDISPGRDVDWTDLQNLVSDALDDADDLHPYGIQVAVETDGRVVLSGFVDDEKERQRFEQIAGQVDGVKAVVNRLQLRRLSGIR